MPSHGGGVLDSLSPYGLKLPALAFINSHRSCRTRRMARFATQPSCSSLSLCGAYCACSNSSGSNQCQLAAHVGAQLAKELSNGACALAGLQT